MNCCSCGCKLFLESIFLSAASHNSCCDELFLRKGESEVAFCKRILECLSVGGFFFSASSLFRAVRECANISPSDAAKMLYVSTRTLRSWENGDSKVPPAMFELLMIKILVGMGRSPCS